ncbi:MAG TPA: bifunctional 4-hydroxy-2-oxoglutarate aldolase/2-dehydro-3-deoxy-phosphogluconate aldolase [Baekduia sp.]|nr:bifunctional 4-hydroxy-2-oxoglutarate aldolase/2-dehydro-3-deoxy-phosphogluconate aldolase [Baekduia sp.]
MTAEAALARLGEAGVVAVLRAPTADGAVRAAEALVEGGVTALEVTYSTPDVAAVLARLGDRFGDEVVLGAGTVLESAQAEEAVASGACFLVAPGIDEPIGEAMLATGAATLLGALTPTEVLRARRLGAHAVKLFPGSVAGPGYLRALRGPFPDVPLVPTGGISPANLGEWVDAGAFAVGAGGELAGAAAIGAEDWDGIRRSAERFTAAVDAARGG